MSSRTILIIAPVLLFAVFLSLSPSYVFAVEPNPTETPRELIPCGTVKNPDGTIENPCTPCHTFKLIQNVISFIINPFAWVVAAFMFSIGGIMMIVPGVGGEKSAGMYTKGKKIITNTAVGIILVFVAWITIDTIIKAVAGQQIGGGAAQLFPETLRLGPWNKITCRISQASGPSMPPDNNISPVVRISLEEQRLRAELESAGVMINHTLPCSTNVITLCTTIEGLPRPTIVNLKNIATACSSRGCSVMITGGTEAGHLTHGRGRNVVDLRFDENLANYLKDPGSLSVYRISRICSQDPARYSYNCTARELQPHLHVEFRQ